MTDAEAASIPHVPICTDAVMLPSLSVVIPHLNQETYLQRCLASLQPQIDQHDDVEIIVVDNGSYRLPTDVVMRFPRVRLEQEAAPGPGLARNKGVALSKGKILAFIDSDCIAHPDWISIIRRKLSENLHYYIIGGDVRIAMNNPPQMSVLEAYESIFAYRQKEYIERMGFSGTGNLAMWRSTYEEVGPFRGILVAEDRDWGHRAARMGYKIGYVPQMIVYHPARSSFNELYQKWDRHLAHDFELYATGRLGRTKWLLLTIAVAISPIVEVWRILRSTRVSGIAPRLSAFQALLRVRLYRSKRMLRMIARPSPSKAASWNRDR